MSREEATDGRRGRPELEIGAFVSIVVSERARDRGEGEERQRIIIEEGMDQKA